MPIQVLPTHLVNKIAAGEVIERPASLVKELVENALDSGATRIDVALQDGGRKLVAVTDNGGGMGPQDLALAFAPHATSKIAVEADLDDIETMGFRGEALASIASVSHAHIRSTLRLPDGTTAPEGYEVEASGETIGPARPCPATAGTTVTVRDLFFNTPARRKFLKTANTELGHVSEQLARLALPHPQVAFALSHNGRTIANLPAAAGTLQRARDLFGDELADHLLPIAARSGPVKIAGLIAPPAAARASARWQYFFLNGRYIRDRLLAHALREAFRGLVDPSRSPAALIFVTLDPREVDVNVHPTKIEVRFRDGQLVYGELLAALRETLNRSNLVAPAILPPTAPTPEHQEETEQRRESIRSALADFFRSAAPPQRRLDFPPQPPSRTRPVEQQEGQYIPTPRVGADADLAPPATTAPTSLEAVTGGESAATQPISASSLRSEHSGSSSVEPATAISAEKLSVDVTAMPAQAIQVHNAYIVTAVADGLLIVDQHALHERLLYNDLRRRLEQGPLTGQRMLIPAALKVTASEADLLGRFENLLTRLGIEVAPFGPDTYAVQRFPALLAGRGVDAAEFLRDVLDKLTEDESISPERMLEEILEMLACKAAVKAGQPLSAAEMQSLLARCEDAEKASACPHGRPTSIKLSLRELEKQFKRT